jgi:hypothetical protein
VGRGERERERERERQRERREEYTQSWAAEEREREREREIEKNTHRKWQSSGHIHRQQRVERELIHTCWMIFTLERWIRKRGRREERERIDKQCVE